MPGRCEERVKGKWISRRVGESETFLGATSRVPFREVLMN